MTEDNKVITLPLPVPVPEAKSTETLNALRNLLYADDKPTWLKTVDVLLLGYLILRMADDHEIFDSQHTLATRFGCDKRTISAAINRLKGRGWISARRRKYSTSALSVNLSALPQTRCSHQLPSENAVKLANAVVEMLKPLNPKRRYTKAAVYREAVNAERIIGYCGGNPFEAWNVVSFALTSDKWWKRARSGLYFVNMNCAKIRADFFAFTSGMEQKCTGT